MNRQSKVEIAWSPSFAYALGLIATDGNLSKDGRHINFTSKEAELINSFKKCLQLNNKIGLKARGGSKDKKYFQIQFGDKNFYQFLINIGLTPAKSKTISALSVPDNYFADFLRGCIDGDGNINVHMHSESQHPQLKIRIFSASSKFLDWIKIKLQAALDLKGGWMEKGPREYILCHGKDDSIKILRFMYYKGSESYLDRKYRIAEQFL